MAVSVAITPPGGNLESCEQCHSPSPVLGFDTGRWLCGDCAGLDLAPVIAEVNRLWHKREGRKAALS